MANELTERNENLISIVSNNNLGDVLKPLTREIHLFDSFVAGVTYLKDTSVLDGIENGDRLTLQREDNKFDDNAILILNSDNKKLCYVPERDNLIFARLMDAGKCLEAKVDSIEKKGTYTKIRIGIYLIDF